MKFLALIPIILFSTLVHSQTKISGVVKDVDGEPIAYANVIFKDSYEGTITNEDGRFYMESDETYQYVIFSFIGFSEKTIELNQHTNYNMEITLEEEASALEEVVIISGKQSKKNNPAIDILKKIWENRTI